MTDIGVKSAPKATPKPPVVADEFVFVQPDPEYVDSLDPAVQDTNWLDEQNTWAAQQLAAVLAPEQQPAAAQAKAAPAKVEASSSVPLPQKRVKQTILKVVNDNLTVGIQRNVTILGRMHAAVKTWLVRHVILSGKAAGGAVASLSKGIAHAVKSAAASATKSVKKATGSVGSWVQSGWSYLCSWF